MSRLHFKAPIKHWRWIVVLLVPFALFAVISDRNSWRRPQTLVRTGHRTVDVRISPDGRYLATGGDYYQEASSAVLLYDMTMRRMVQKINQACNPIFVGANYLVVERPHGPEVYSLLERKLIARTSENFGYYAAMPDGKLLVGSLWIKDRWKPNFVWDFSNQTLRQNYSQLPTLGKDIHAEYELLADQQTLLIRQQHTMFDGGENVGGGVAGMQLWDVKERKARMSMKNYAATRQFASTPDGLCAFLLNYRVEFWNFQNGQFINAFSIGKYELEQMALSPNGELLAVVDSNDRETIHLWDTKTGQLLRSLPTEQGMVSSIVFTPDGRSLVSAGIDTVHTVQLWRIK